MRFIQGNRKRTIEAVVYPTLLVIVLWTIFFLDKTLHLDLYKFGLKPQSIEGLRGVLFMPFIHGQKDYSHIINNSLPTLVLLGTLIYFYREIAFKVVVILWFGTGILLWYIAETPQTYHIGISGILYGLFGFLLFSGFLKKYLPLQAISLFVAFVYGSMIWGIFPLKEGVSWEGHLSGLIMGVLLAFVFRKQGPQPPKYVYEIEAEMGIEPPDFEAQIREAALQREKEQEELKQNALETQNQDSNKEQSTKGRGIEVVYLYQPKNKDNQKEK